MVTIIHRLAEWADSNPNSYAQGYKKNGEWINITAREYCNRVYWLALFLESKGMTTADIGTILSYNCPEWVHFELASLLLGAKSAGIYPNSLSKDILYVLNHTESRFFAVQNREYFEKIKSADSSQAGQSNLPDRIQVVIVFDSKDAGISPKAVSYESAIEQGKKLANAPGAKPLKAYLDALDPKNGAFLIYTSGTTGTPKGALLSHDNLVYTIDRGIEHWGLKVGGGTLFSFLPLCHIAEQLQNLGGGIGLRYQTNFCSKFDNVSSELPEVQPTLLLCVPRLWEKMMEGVMAKVEASKPAKKALVNWAFGVGTRVAEAKYSNKNLSPLDQVQWALAQKLVINKVKKALGLEKAEVLVSGAAALHAHVCKWFRSLGLEILEDFGQSESTGIICMTMSGVDCAGTVGKPVSGLDVKIADDGEILTRGRHVFLGYYKDEQATAQVLEGGWLHTGDLAEVTPEGFIRIRGRKKEILKTSGGKMVAPLPIEEALKEAPIISQVCMVGDGKKFLAALITLSEGKLAEIKSGKSSHKEDNGVIHSPEVLKEVQAYIDHLNKNLASYEQIKKFAVLTREFSIQEGEMTPTLKMKRDVIERKYSKVINEFYESRGA